jgi:magnesium-transporting ATPase (P-type)
MHHSINECEGRHVHSFAHFVYSLSVVIDDESKTFQAESPDEEALVKAAKDLGWEFIGTSET